jgi:hypothetical protein
LLLSHGLLIAHTVPAMVMITVSNNRPNIGKQPSPSWCFGEWLLFIDRVKCISRVNVFQAVMVWCHLNARWP